MPAALLALPAAALLALVLPLSLDTFAVAAALGAAGVRRRRVSLTLAAFEGGMPVAGALAGAALGDRIGSAADLLAAAASAAAGALLILADDDERRLRALADARGATLLALAAAVSVDELAAGFGIGLLRLPVALVAVLLAVQAFAAAELGMWLGQGLAGGLREGAEKLAGAALLAAAAAVMLERFA